MEYSSQELLDQYFNWYKSKYTIKELNNSSEIITPFVNHINDRIALYVKTLSNNNIKISDDGVTLQELDMMGFKFTDTRERTLSNIMSSFGISKADDVLYVIVENAADFPQKKHNLIQAILKIYDLLFVSANKVKNMFHEDVYDFLYENDFGGTKADLAGKSIKYSIDYVLGATKNRPQTIIQFLNKPSFESIAAQAYIYNDLRDAYIDQHMKTKYVVIANDANQIPKKSIMVANDIGIDLIGWSNKEKIIALK
ncbi:hypothetical protein CKN63_03270 [Carnobacterium divergens]|uniref:DUF1828 domain-containing protein n=1 Tax=Carnobacterium divergens TaxID=2748 RepID=UPI001072D52D|nr:DUF1828 domain-containing protein [Carnobacterium divergens]TFI67834.1 hypothetical protein CKN59_03230 [Carnobacterium divergens]TFI67880.1 hypothetical protein CKN76_03305 [Carnobacterium divergens]TFI82780.1 hypothetical protein CKN74_03270 [Carnobacterium divergens]TFJ08901.1 hypothetical protein CKN75_03300 [Carnobacterium divergens]TFJ14035.1 hypothetical protein CKN71_03300 [Carnobacterium divergens]